MLPDVQWSTPEIGDLGISHELPCLGLLDVLLGALIFMTLACRPLHPVFDKHFVCRTTMVGPTGEDEMCNFYMMYWVEGKDTIQPNTCFTR